MSVGIIGSRAYLGLAQEVTYGTAVPSSTHWARMISSSLEETRDIVRVPQMTAFGAASAVDRDTVEVGIDAGGDIVLPLYYDAFASNLLLLHALGAVATAGAGPYTHTYTLDEDGVVGLTIQQNHGEHASLPTVEVYEGVVVNTIEISAEAKGFVTMTLGLIAEASGGLTTITGSPSFGTEEQMLAHHAAKPSWNSLNHQARSWSIRVDKKLGRRPYVSSKYTDCPQATDATEISFRGTFEWVADDLYDGLRAGTVDDLVIALTGTGNNAGQITLHNMRITKVSKPVNSKGILVFDVEGIASSDATDGGIEIVITNDNTGAIS